MTRTDDDSWDLGSSVGATATMVAAARALASTEPDALINDPWAADLVRAVGTEFFTRLVDHDIEIPPGSAGDGVRLLTDSIAVRTRFFDDFFVDAGRAGIRQAVILAAGLDSRSYRLSWADGTVIYEIDQPRVIDFKNHTMAALGAAPGADLRWVAVDLREDWPAALRATGFDPAEPSAWSAEGLLMYLPPDAQDRLFDNITALTGPGSRLATEFHGGDFGQSLAERSTDIAGQWADHGFDVDLSALFYPGERNHVVDYLGARGWRVTTRARRQLFADYGREFPETATPLENSVAVTATRD